MAKKYYWIKLKTDFFDEPTIDFLLSQKNGCEYIVLYQMLCLKTSNTNGYMHSTVGEMIIPYDVEKIARDTKYFDFDTIAVALELYKKLGLVYEDKKGVLKIADFETMVGSGSLDEHTKKLNADRQKRYREKQKKLSNNVTVTEDVTLNSNVEIDIRDRDKILDINNKEINKETYVSVINGYTQNSELTEALKGYVEMRKKMKGFTVRSLKLRLNSLNNLANDDESKTKIVNNAVENSWKGFYPLKETKDDREGYAF